MPMQPKYQGKTIRQWARIATTLSGALTKREEQLRVSNDRVAIEVSCTKFAIEQLDLMRENFRRREEAYQQEQVHEAALRENLSRTCTDLSVKLADMEKTLRARTGLLERTAQEREDAIVRAMVAEKKYAAAHEAREEWHQKYHDQGIELVNIRNTRNDREAQVRALIEALEYFKP